MTKTKNRLKFLSILVALVFLAVSLLSIAIRSTTISELQTRTIDVNEIGTLSYEDKYNQFLEQFTQTSSETTENQWAFNGQIAFDNNLNKLEFLSTDIEDVNTEILGTLNLTSEEFLIQTSYFVDNVLIDLDTNELKPYYDEQTNDVLLLLDDNTVISITEVLQEENINECFAPAIPLFAWLFGMIFVATVVPVVLSPSFAEPASDALSTISNWFKSLFGSKSVPKHKELTKAQKEQSKKKPTSSVYQLAYCTNTSPLKISSVKLNYLASLALLNTIKELGQTFDNVDGLAEEVAGVDIDKLPEQAKVDVKSIPQGKNVHIGVYTPNIIDAARLAFATGADQKTPAETHNTNRGSKYYYHFHDSAHLIHIWFGSAI